MHAGARNSVTAISQQPGMHMQVSRTNMLQVATNTTTTTLSDQKCTSPRFFFFLLLCKSHRDSRSPSLDISLTYARKRLTVVRGGPERSLQGKFLAALRSCGKQPYGSQALKKISALFPIHPLPRIVHMSVTSRPRTTCPPVPLPPPPLAPWPPGPPTPCASLVETDGRQSRMSQLQNAQASQNQAGVQGVKTVPSSLPPSARPMWHSSNLVPNSVHQRHFPQIVFESYAPALVGARYIWLISHNLSQPEM